MAARRGVWALVRAKKGRCAVGARRFRARNRASRPRVVGSCGLRLRGLRRRRVCVVAVAVCAGCEESLGCDSSCRGRCGGGPRLRLSAESEAGLRTRPGKARRRKDSRRFCSQARSAWRAPRLIVRQLEGFVRCICAEMASGRRKQLTCPTKTFVAPAVFWWWKRAVLASIAHQ